MSSFEAFKSAFKGDLVTPTDPDYDKAISRWAHNAARRAKVVAFVKDAEDVSLAVKYASGEKLPIAIKGGGHNPAGASSSEGGLVIDLGKYINTVKVDPAKKVGYVGGGALWETVDKTAIEHGLAAVGGTVNHTGVGGLTLGGGYGWLSTQHGLAIDNLLQVTMVLADGSIKTASEVENADLFWAVRGGGCNFGVCIEFVFQLHEQRRTVFSGPIIFGGHQLEPVLKAVEAWWTKGPSNKESLLQVLTRGPPPDRHPCVVLMPFYNGSAEEGKKVFKAFFDLNPIADHSGELPYEVMNSLQNPMVTHGSNVYMRGVIQERIKPEVSASVFKKMAELTVDPTFRVTMVFEYFVLDKINSVSNTAMAFNNRGTHQNVLGACAWDEHTPENSKGGRDVVYALTDIISNAEKDSDVSETRSYGNYLGDEVVSNDRAAKLFGENYQRLRELKRKYDPNVIFNKWCPITPAA